MKKALCLLLLIVLTPFYGVEAQEKSNLLFWRNIAVQPQYKGGELSNKTKEILREIVGAFDEHRVKNNFEERGIEIGVGVSSTAYLQFANRCASFLESITNNSSSIARNTKFKTIAENQALIAFKVKKGLGYVQSNSGPQKLTLTGNRGAKFMEGKEYTPKMNFEASNLVEKLLNSKHWINAFWAQNYGPGGSNSEQLIEFLINLENFKAGPLLYQSQSTGDNYRYKERGIGISLLTKEPRIFIRAGYRIIYSGKKDSLAFYPKDFHTGFLSANWQGDRFKASAFISNFSGDSTAICPAPLNKQFNGSWQITAGYRFIFLNPSSPVWLQASYGSYRDEGFYKVGVLGNILLSHFVQLDLGLGYAGTELNKGFYGFLRLETCIPKTKGRRIK